MFKKLLVILMAMALFVPSAVYAQGLAAASDATIVESGSCGENVTYTLDSNGLVTISGSGDMYVYKDPQDFEGRPSPFKGNTNIKSVVIEDGVTSVGDHTFYTGGGLKSLKSVKLGDSVKYIGNAAFCDCDIENLSFGDSVYDIGPNAFSYNENLKKVSLPDSVQFIRYDAFKSCEALTELYFSKNLVKIEDYAFYECNSLKYPEIPDSVTSIGKYAFAECGNLRIVIIGASVTSIGEGAFRRCRMLISASLGRSVTNIGQEAFLECPNMENMTIPDSVKSIGDRAVGYNEGKTYQDSPYVIDGFTIYGNSGSEAQNYANRNNITFKLIESASGDDETCEDGHSYGKWKITKPATEISPGKKTRICTVCGKKETKTIAQLAPTLKAVKISKPKAAKKSMTVKWKKVSKKKLKKIKKIQIQYSTDKTFKTGVKTKYAKAKKTSLKIKKLKSKKKYYVRIRAYTKSRNTVHVSKWSAVKSVKVSK